MRQYIKNLFHCIAKFFIEFFNHPDPVKDCDLFKDKGCVHVDGVLCDFPCCSMNNKYKEQKSKARHNIRHKIHNHPMTEYREKIPDDKVLVDKEFFYLFDKYEPYWDSHHIIVDKQKFLKLTNSQKIKRQDMNNLNNKTMKTTDEKAKYYTARLCNQSDSFTKGEVETAYVTGAIEASRLQIGDVGAFGQAIETIKFGFAVARQSWGNSAFITKQIDSHIPKDIVPKMQSLPESVKEIITAHGDGSIQYHAQCLIVFPHREGGLTATNYIPNWEDMFAEDWVIIS